VKCRNGPILVIINVVSDKRTDRCNLEITQYNYTLHKIAHR